MEKSGPSGAVPTLGELFEYYMQHHGSACRRAHDMRLNFRRYVGALAERRSDEIKPTDVLLMRDYLATHRGRYAANRALELINAVYRRCNSWELIDLRNPADSVKLFPNSARDRFLSADEISRLFEGMEKIRTKQFINYLKICLYTGAREGTVRTMRWRDIDLAAGVWRIPMTKNGQPHVVPLLAEALQAIEAQHGKHPEWVFPGRGKTGHLVNPTRAWKRLLNFASIENARIHDLRRTMGSWQAKTGASLPIIGKTLAHQNSRATHIYARLDLDPVREAMEKAARAMHGKSGADSPSKLDAVQVDAIAEALAAKLKGVDR